MLGLLAVMASWRILVSVCVAVVIVSLAMFVACWLLVRFWSRFEVLPDFSSQIDLMSVFSLFSSPICRLHPSSSSSYSSFSSLFSFSPCLVMVHNLFFTPLLFQSSVFILS